MQPSRRAVDGPGHEGESRSNHPERWSHVKALFLEALSYPELERSAFVACTCGDDAELRKELDSLLASDKAASSFGERPAAWLLADAVLTDSQSVPHLPIGSQLGSHEVTGFIAAGGMGEVYRARHTLLGREVAIKTIAPGLTDAAARRRLLREARHTSRLAHPNICAIHDVGESDGIPFIVMEYVDGRTLSAIVRERVPPLHDALAYGAQVASALAHAHTQGIIHRDLKGSNVVIAPNGQAIVLDFGLARLLPEATELVSREATVTRPDALAGTLSHMAPELLRGDPADVRSDVWALGVLLYELVTGELPFAGRTPFETSSAILGEAPRPMRGRVPLAVRLVVERCLIKNPDARYQRAQHVADALAAIQRRRAWPVVGRLLVSARQRTLYAAAATVVLVPALAVSADRLHDEFGATFSRRISTLAMLPLANATGDPAADYYADGITDAIISHLGAASEVRVFSRASTTRAARAGRSVTEIGDELGADVIVQGELRRDAQQVAIDARLVRPADGRVIWSETYERHEREVLALQADVARALAGAIQSTLRPAARDRLAAVRAVSPEVYELYLKGRFAWNLRTPRSVLLAIEHFSRAIELDPTYAPAHAALADCFNQLGTVMLGSGSPRDYRPRAAAAAIRALQIDPASAEAHAALGYAWHYEWRWTEAEREFRRAIELNPSYSLARIWYANLLLARSRVAEAIEQVTAARELDPFSLVINTNVGWVLDGAGRAEEAIVQLRRTLDLDSSYAQARWRLAAALMSAGRFGEALHEGNEVVALSDSSLPALTLLAHIEARAGRRDAARSRLEDVVVRSRRQIAPAGPIALAFEALGDTESALLWLERAFADRSNAIAYLAVDYRNSPLRYHPRFHDLLVRTGLE